MRAGDVVIVDRSGLPQPKGGLVRVQPDGARVEVVAVNHSVATVRGPAGETIEPVRMLRMVEGCDG